MRAKQSSIARPIIVLASAAVALGTATFAPAQIRVISPPTLANAEGDGNVTGTGGPGRVQYLFPASDFAGLPASHRVLVSWNLRGDASQTVPVNWTAAEKVWISTTDKDSLTSVFDDNHGPDKTLVHDGAISFPILSSGPATGPRDFADGTPFQLPFFYDPSKGNLLIEEIALVNSVPYPGPNIDFQSSAEIRVLSSGSPNSTTGNLHNVSAVIQFVFVPEPSSLVVAGVALFVLGCCRLRSHRPK